VLLHIFQKFFIVDDPVLGILIYINFVNCCRLIDDDNDKVLLSVGEDF